MRIALTLFLLALMLQPMESGACVMGDDADHGSNAHATVSKETAQSHDCCDDESSPAPVPNPVDECCDPGIQCMAANVAVAAIPVEYEPAFSILPTVSPGTAPRAFQAPIPAPALRPPIS